MARRTYKPTWLHRVEYTTSKALVGLARLMSSRLADRFGKNLGLVVHRIWGRRRELARKNMQAALGNSLSEAQVHENVKSAFQSIGRTFVEFARFGVTDQESIRSMVVPDGQSHFERARERGKGAILLTSHFGNWEIMGAWVASIGHPVDLLVGRQSNPLIHEMINGFRRTIGVGVIELPEQLRQVFKSLRNNRVIGMIADQHAPSESMIIDFFGRPASAARGPAVFATRCDCPIIPAVLIREAHDRHRVVAGQPIYPPHSGDDEADIRSMTHEHNRFFEDCIRKNPTMWMWTHNRWKLPANLPLVEP